MQDLVCAGLHNGSYGNWSVAPNPCFYSSKIIVTLESNGHRVDSLYNLNSGTYQNCSENF